MNLLGCAFSYLPVIFDLWYETDGHTQFNIYKNIPVVGELAMTNDDLYDCHFHELGSRITQPEMGVSFGVTGPRAKHAVFNYFREMQQLDASHYASLVHPTVYRSVSAELTSGLFIGPKVSISSQARLGFGVSVKHGSIISHHVQIGEFTEINPGVVISGNVHIGKGCILGTGAMVMSGVTIGENTIIGMGSVVTKDIPAGVVAYGNPCKVVANNEKGIPTIVP